MHPRPVFNKDYYGFAKNPVSQKISMPRVLIRCLQSGIDHGGLFGLRPPHPTIILRPIMPKPISKPFCLLDEPEPLNFGDRPMAGTPSPQPLRLVIDTTFLDDSESEPIKRGRRPKAFKSTFTEQENDLVLEDV